MSDIAPAEQPVPEEPRPGVEHPSNYCPLCSQRLAAKSCKLICASCGYYMSCSDYV